VKLAPVHYVRPRSEAELLDALARYGPDAAVLAGGQSLMPELALRSRTVKVLVDINHLPEADTIALTSATDGMLQIGSLVRHGDLLKHDLVQRHAPAWAAAAAHVGNVAVRNRGTVCGSMAHADPGGEIPLIAVASGARVHLRSLAGSRDVDADAFFTGAFSTVRRPDEFVAAVQVPVNEPDSFHFFEEIARRPTAPALASIALSLNRIIGQPPSMAVAIGGVSDRPRLLRATSERLTLALRDTGEAPETTARSGIPFDVDATRAILQAELAPFITRDDAAYRLHLAVALLVRAMTAMRSHLRPAMPCPSPST
jgi:CO/xanthine dehydrogenase FAD-binding subunit